MLWVYRIWEKQKQLVLNEASQGSKIEVHPQHGEISTSLPASVLGAEVAH